MISSMKKNAMIAIFVVLVLIVAAIILYAFKEKGDNNANEENTGGSENMQYTSITMEEAKDIFKEDDDYIILDVRRTDEFAEGHIPGAINVANEDIVDEKPVELPDEKQTIYVYCRSGNRSKHASDKLAGMGYQNIVEIGGIIDWTGEIEE